MAATIYEKKNMISYGFNSRKSHPLMLRFNRRPDRSWCIHAEIAALANARQSVAGMTMYVARVFRDDTSALAKPCEGCQKAIVEFGLGDVVWTS